MWATEKISRAGQKRIIGGGDFKEEIGVKKIVGEKLNHNRQSSSPKINNG